MNISIERYTQIYKFVRQNKCLCAMNSDVFLENMLSELFSMVSKTTDQDGEKLLLYTSTLSAIGETFYKEISTHGYICSKIYYFMKNLLDDSVWSTLVELLICTKDKFCVWMLTKALSTIIYCFPKPLLQRCINHILKVMKSYTMLSESFQPLLNLLTFICNYESKTKIELCNYDTEGAQKCKGRKPSEVSPVLDISQCFCIELIHYWPGIMVEFKSMLNKQNSENLISDFLDFWKSVIDTIEKQKNEDLITIYMNSQSIFDFFILVNQIPSVCLHTYLNLIIQIFSSSVKYQPWKDEEIPMLEKSIVDAFDNRFLTFMLSIKDISRFYQLEPVSKRALGSEYSVFAKKDSVITNKAIYITLCACAGMKSEESLSSILLETETFLKENSFIPLSSPGYLWALDIFFEQDDLLFGIMLALLRIYTFFKGTGHGCNETTSKLLINYNAHKVFIDFLCRIGHHHHTLLEFLMTSETCFLLYLTLYLKFLICDWENFIALHDNFKESPQCQNIASSSEISVLHEVDKKYSNTFSCDSEIASSTNNSDEQHWKEKLTNAEHLKSNYFSSVMVLINLRNSIKKLVQWNEFPYNVQYLMGLLDCCEDKHQTFITSAQQ